jgi:hypothetical protein
MANIHHGLGVWRITPYLRFADMKGIGKEERSTERALTYTQVVGDI